MVRVIEDTVGKIRCLSIQQKLKEVLAQAGEQCGIDVVRVISGGQPAKGTAGRRVGSTRHDLGWAADLQLERASRSLSFARPAELAFFEQFVSVAAQLGVTGIGAGIGYMGPLTMHVGYGTEAVWGAGGKVAAAPVWLRAAFAEGKARRGQPVVLSAIGPAAGAAPPAAEHIVAARNGLNVRSGPGSGTAVIGSLVPGTHVWCDPGEQGAEWRRIDLQDDGLYEGYVFAAYLSAV